MKVTIQGEITERLADKFVATLRACDEDIILLIDSPGGLVGAALEMASAVETFKGRIDAVLIEADSAALIPALPASSITCALDGSYLLHPVSIEIPSRTSVSPAEMREAADDSDVVFRKITRMMEAKSGHTDGFWRLLACEGRRLSSEAMLELHLADRVSPYPRAWLRRPGVSTLSSLTPAMPLNYH